MNHQFLCSNTVAKPEKKKRVRAREFCGGCMRPLTSNHLTAHWLDHHSELPVDQKKLWDRNEETRPSPEECWADEATVQKYIDDPSLPLPRVNKGQFTPHRASKANEKSLASKHFSKLKEEPGLLGKRSKPENYPANLEEEKIPSEDLF